MIKPQEFSQTLKDILNLADIQLLQLCLIQRPELSASVAMFETCYSVFQEFKPYESYKTNIISLTPTKQVNHDPISANSDAYTALNDLIDNIDTKWLKDNARESFIAFSSMDLLDQIVIFGQATAICANRSFIRSGDDSIYDAVMSRSNFDKWDYYTPTYENYFNRLGVEPLREQCVEIFGQAWLDKYTKMNRRTLATQAEKSYRDLETQEFIPVSFYFKDEEK